eukprot:CAMPEP_0172435088 /NCGR_PEP_ID=MMETSP1064-20121228/70989_1 /TAXON_ID=202472 /ORGANISM="Aulacoseira subarctica , Strain CCAP 1002/5" /LENGTH=199 /DNA_ID=CAMNT_0013183369 /DNA_START=1 /DNA_END=600 /DNA_ORIENTATION=-
MEFVSLRDIYPHEEIFVVYGVEWERAWQKHVNDWLPAPGTEMHMTAEEAMEKWVSSRKKSKRRRLILKMYELPVSSATMNTHYMKMPTKMTIFSRYIKLINSNQGMTNAFDGAPFLKGTLRTTTRYFLIFVIEPQAVHLPEDCILPDDEIFYVNNVPSNKVNLVDVEYSRDQYLPHAFRHFIHLPDDLYPDTWKQNRSK